MHLFCCLGFIDAAVMELSKAKANFTRVCQLLVDKGSDALRAALHAIHPASTLSAVLFADYLHQQQDVMLCLQSEIHRNLLIL